VPPRAPYVHRISHQLRIDDAPRFVARSLAMGATAVHVREPGLSARALHALVEAVVGAASGSSLTVLVSDRLDVALAAGAHGVHLPSSGLPVARARAIAPPGFIVGRSAHSASEVEAAAGADFVLFGTVFETPSKPGVGAQGLPALAAAVQQFRGPVLAIGGVSADRVAAVLDAGAAGFAAIRLFV
jgi:thiamine-phosphate pyrophosphorylase